MKNQILFLVALLVSVTAFSQKDEIKAAEKALKASDFNTVLAEMNKAESMVSAMDDKTKAKYYYLKGEAYAGLSKTDPTAANYTGASEAFNELFALEKEMGSSKYSALAEPTLNTMVSDLTAKGSKSYQSKDYASAKSELKMVYDLSPRDTIFLDYAATAAYLDQDFDTAIEYYTELKDLGWTGIATEYTAINKETGERENMGSQNNMDLLVKSGTYSDPQVTVSESKQANTIKMIAFSYAEKGDTEKAIQAVKEARAVAPDDANLIITEANLQIKLGNKEEFANLMNEAIALDPNNHVLYFNLGVISAEHGDFEKAKEYYEKTIELNPQYREAYTNLAATILEKDKELVDEMNKNLSNFDKFDEIKAQQVDLYKSVIPLYEKAYELAPDDLDTVRTLMSLYENTGMDAEFQSMREKYDAMK